MSEQTANTLLLFLLYGAYVLLPMIPAIAIFYIFPDTSVAVDGPLSGVTVRAGGAFAAYMIVVLLSWHIVGGIAVQMEHPDNPVWALEATVLLEDPAGKPVYDNDLLKSLTVQLVPPTTSITNQFVDIKIPGSTGDYKHIDFYIKDFGDTPVTLDDATMVKRDDVKKRIEIIKPVVIRSLGFTSAYNRSDYTTTDLGRGQKVH